MLSLRPPQRHDEDAALTLSPALIAALPFLGALLAGLSGRLGRNAPAVVASCATALALACLLALAPAVLSGQTVTTQIGWVPALGLNASFALDGLGLLFAGLILGIGLLVILYARFYLDTDEPQPRFMACLMLFQGAMTGLVLSDNILLLVVFWELTSLSSFLLIGWWRHLPEGRQGARMALAVTGAGGLALLAGALILGQIAGSHDLSQILHQRAAIQASPMYRPALILILLGAFTKSAQVPFHFWLPHAMAAPTPVSAYLHSATMVKAGLYLMARLWPVLAGTPDWTAIVATTGLVTLVTGAVIALFKDDMKAILAYSTVSHLGLITFLLGLGTPQAATAAMLHILVHASFKAPLFMLVGIVDHATHTRDIRRLGGLARAMPLTFVLGAVATLSMAGVPPLNGFLSKELMLTEALGTPAPWLFGLLATGGALLSVGYALRFLAQVFLGRAAAPLPRPPHDPGPGLWVAPAVLVALVVLSGLLPMPVLAPLVDAAATAVTGTTIHAHLSLLHGSDAPALWASLAALGGGVMLAGGVAVLRRLWDRLPRPDAKALFDSATDALAHGARAVTAGLHDERLPRMLWTVLAASLGLGLWALLGQPLLPQDRTGLPITPLALVGWAMVMAATLATAALHRDRLLALLLTGIVGLLVSAAFAWLSAPDLALTQIAVEVVTILLMLLTLNLLPRQTPRESAVWRRLRDAALAVTSGGAVAWLAFALMTREARFDPISAFHWAQSKPGAGGTNAVNTIIVDFRGYDTYGEIIVLGIAALIILALAEAVLNSPAARRALAALDSGPNRGEAHPPMLLAGARLMMPMALMVGVYLYLRGHNLPGGGFVAGLVVAIAILLQYMAAGFVWSDRRAALKPQQVIAAGVLVSSLTGAGAWVFGLPFLTSGFAYVSLGPLGKVELTTASLFDLGVFLCVLGAVMLSLATLSRLAQRTPDRDGGR